MYIHITNLYITMHGDNLKNVKKKKKTFFWGGASEPHESTLDTTHD